MVRKKESNGVKKKHEERNSGVHQCTNSKEEIKKISQHPEQVFIGVNPELHTSE